MALWLVRAGRNGEQEDLALDQGLAVIGWRQIPDLDGIGSRDELKALYAELDPNQSVNRIANPVCKFFS
jgi:restriction system protein